MTNQVVDGFKLSSQQKHVWKLMQAGYAGRVLCAVLIEGKLDADALREALQAIIQRHEILRTTFQDLPGMKYPVQVIADQLNPLWQQVDLKRQSEQEQAIAIKEICVAERAAELNFRHGPVVRITLALLGEERHMLVLNLPALCADEQTLRNLLTKLVQRYGASLRGKTEAGLSGVEMQYADYAEWQNELLSASDADARAGRAYWQEHHLTQASALALPFQNNTRQEAPLSFASVDCLLAEDTSAKLRAVAQERETSMANLLFACWHVLIHRLTGAAEVTIGNLCSGRKFEELQSSLGLFARYLPISCRFEGNLRFTEILRLLEAATQSAEVWQDHFNREMDWSSTDNLPRILPIGFDYTEQPAEQRTTDVCFSLYSQEVSLEHFNVRLSCLSMAEGLRTKIYYDPALFHKEYIKCLAGQFVALLKAVLEEPDAPVTGMQILSEAERHKLLVEWNDTATDYSQPVCIQRLFEAQVERTPEAVAAVSEHEQISYEELNRRANQLARYLRKRGVGPDVLVGICLERSTEMITGVLGVLKAGGAYVPLDGEFPAARLAYMLENTQARLLLTQEHLLHLLPEFAGEILCLDRGRHLFEAEDDSNPEAITACDNLAYVVHTSGSTGKPKGVLSTHRGVVNYLTYLARTYQLKSDDVSLQIAALPFDASVRDILGPLTCGAKVALLSQAEAREPVSLLRKIKEQRVTVVLSIVPTMLGAVLEAARDQDFRCDTVRLILVSGEVLSASLCQSAQDIFGSEVRIVNQYGPTECTMTSSFYPVQEAHAQEPTILIGRPIPNSQFYLLDEQLNPVPIGVKGELYIGGAGVASGYLNQPDYTAERFIPHPFSTMAGARLYRTGDLARYQPDGNLDFLGRADYQVKVRGLRIELREIEALLAAHPAVQSAVVMLREDEPENKRLVAYIVPHRGRLSRNVAGREQFASDAIGPYMQMDEQGGTGPHSPLNSNGHLLSVNSLRQCLKEQLPEYMLPSVFVMLDQLPLTANGKVDRQALPVPEQARPELPQAFVAPRTPVEQEIAEMWAEVLGLERVGVDDNFFDLGGHSLLAIQLFSRLTAAFQINLPLARLFEAPTVAELALLVTQAQVEEEDEEEIARMIETIKYQTDDALSNERS